MPIVTPSESFETTAQSFPEGLVGTIGVHIDDNVGNTVLARTTAGIIELDPGLYAVTLVAPAILGQYTIVWDSGDVPLTPSDVASDDLLVVAESALFPPLPVPDPGAGVGVGPCAAWVTVDEIAECCGADVGTFTALYEDAATMATQILYPLAGGQFNGVCSRTIRPVRGKQSCWWWIAYPSNAQYWTGWDWYVSDGDCCGCEHVSEIILPGYPVIDVTQVLIDGAVVDPATYRVDDYRRLVRVTPTASDTRLRWPSCQNLSLPSTQVGTFQVTYAWGNVPPMTGVKAAAALACEIFKQCDPTGGGETCALPAGATKLVRQGITIDRGIMLNWSQQNGAWATGLPLVDAFLTQVNPYRLRRRAMISTPDVPVGGRQHTS